MKILIFLTSIFISLYAVEISMYIDMGTKENLFVDRSQKCKAFIDPNENLIVPVDVPFSKDEIIKKSLIPGGTINIDYGDDLETEDYVRCYDPSKYKLVDFHPSIFMYSSDNILVNRGFIYSPEFANFVDGSKIFNNTFKYLEDILNGGSNSNSIDDDLMQLKNSSPILQTMNTPIKILKYNVISKYIDNFLSAYTERSFQNNLTYDRYLTIKNLGGVFKQYFDSNSDVLPQSIVENFGEFLKIYKYIKTYGTFDGADGDVNNYNFDFINDKYDKYLLTNYSLYMQHIKAMYRLYDRLIDTNIMSFEDYEGYQQPSVDIFTDDSSEMTIIDGTLFKLDKNKYINNGYLIHISCNSEFVKNVLSSDSYRQQYDKCTEYYAKYKELKAICKDKIGTINNDGIMLESNIPECQDAHYYISLVNNIVSDSSNNYNYSYEYGYGNHNNYKTICDGLVYKNVITNCMSKGSVDEFTTFLYNSIHNIESDYSKAVEKAFDSDVLDRFVNYKYMVDGDLKSSVNSINKVRIYITQTFATQNAPGLFKNIKDMKDAEKEGGDKLIDLSDFEDKSEAMTIFSNVIYSVSDNKKIRIHPSKAYLEGFYMPKSEVSKEDRDKDYDRIKEIIEKNDALADSSVDLIEEEGMLVNNNLSSLPTEPQELEENKILKRLLIIALLDTNINNYEKFKFGHEKTIEKVRDYYNWNGFDVVNNIYMFEANEGGSPIKFIGKYKFDDYSEIDKLMKLVLPYFKGYVDSDDIESAYELLLSKVPQGNIDSSTIINLDVIRHYIMNYDKSTYLSDDAFISENSTIVGDNFVPWIFDLYMLQTYYDITVMDSEQVDEYKWENVKEYYCKSDGTKSYKWVNKIVPTGDKIEVYYEKEKINSKDFKYGCMGQRAFSNEVEDMYILERFAPYQNKILETDDTKFVMIGRERGNRYKPGGKPDVIDENPIRLYSGGFNPNSSSDNKCKPSERDLNIQFLNSNSDYKTSDYFVDVKNNSVVHCDVNEDPMKMVSGEVCNGENPVKYLIEINGNKNFVGKLYLKSIYYDEGDYMNDIVKTFYVCGSNSSLKENPYECGTLEENVLTPEDDSNYPGTDEEYYKNLDPDNVDCSSNSNEDTDNTPQCSEGYEYDEDLDSCVHSE